MSASAGATDPASIVPGSDSRQTGAVMAIERSSLREEVADGIRQHAASQEIAFGEQLPTITALADTLHVSRALVRDALDSLKEAGDVEENGRRWRWKGPQETSGAPGPGTPRGPMALAASLDRGRIQHASLASQATAVLIDLILERELTVGDTLPAANELAEQLGVSVVVVREAVASLAAQGVVERHPGRPPVVTAPSYDVLASILHLRAYLDGIVVKDFIQCRRALEVESVRLAALRSDDELAERLRERLDQMREAGTVEAFHAADLALHLDIAESSDNQALPFLLRTLHTLIVLEMRASFDRVQAQIGDRAVEKTLEVHEAVVDAIAAGDPDAAADAITEHFRIFEID